MPLEFALRPRFDLKRPVRRRWLSRLELPPLALPLAGYWVAVAGVTYALLRSPAADASGESSLEEPARAAPTTPTSNELLAVPSARTREAPEFANTNTNTVADADADANGEQTGVAAPSRLSIPPSARDSAEWHRPDAPGEAQPFPQEERMVRTKRGPSPGARRDEATSFAEAPELADPNVADNGLANSALRSNDAEQDRLVPPSEAPRSGALPSCEAAAASGNQSVDLSALRGPADLSRDAFAAVLENGSYLSACSVPEESALDLCVAVQDGKVVGVTVTTEPRNAALARCVSRAVAGLRFPRSPQLDVTRTRFERAP